MDANRRTAYVFIFIFIILFIIGLLISGGHLAISAFKDISIFGLRLGNAMIFIGLAGAILTSVIASASGIEPFSDSDSDDKQRSGS